ncbi:MAG TPA: RNA 2',3'-cyclic phosphodiesterase, partial [Thermoanaerobaculia bacterium]|nr:RNA 2',3'-cyclic phosphodiesterase [Thermoanaerobaculia bacterium]
FPAAIMQELNARVAVLKPKLAQASWVRPETQHLTFAFLGEQEEALVERITPALEQALVAFPRFDARFHGCGFFPNARRARVGWIGLEPEEPFVDIASAVRAAVVRNGIELDGAAFKPHLTLMRLRDPWPHACIDLFEKSLRSYESEPFEVDTVTLYSSKLSPSGAIHTPLRLFSLAPRGRP